MKFILTLIKSGKISVFLLIKEKDMEDKVFEYITKGVSDWEIEYYADIDLEDIDDIRTIKLNKVTSNSVLWNADGTNSIDIHTPFLNEDLVKIFKRKNPIRLVRQISEGNDLYGNQITIGNVYENLVIDSIYRTGEIGEPEDILITLSGKGYGKTQYSFI